MTFHSESTTTPKTLKMQMIAFKYGKRREIITQITTIT
jgi:undecaprenyl pyrophosphate synthase